MSFARKWALLQELNSDLNSVLKEKDQRPISMELIEVIKKHDLTADELIAVAIYVKRFYFEENDDIKSSLSL